MPKYPSKQIKGKYIHGYTEVKLHILCIPLYHLIDKRTNTYTPLPPSLSLAVFYWPSFFWAVCEEGKGKREKREQHMPVSSGSNASTAQEPTPQPSQENRLGLCSYMGGRDLLYTKLSLNGHVFILARRQQSVLIIEKYPILTTV